MGRSTRGRAVANDLPVPPWLAKVIDGFSTSLWVLPALFCVAGIAAGILIPQIDASFGPFDLLPGWLAASAAGVRSVLATAAGSLATIAGVAFTLTTVTLQLAATQYTPRILRTFMSDRITQVVLGAFLGTVAYLFLLLAGIRSAEEGGGRVPKLSFMIGVAATLGCLALLAFFVDRVLRAIQVQRLVADIGQRAVRRVRSLSFGVPTAEREPPGVTSRICSRTPGFIQYVSQSGLANALPEGFGFATIEVVPGDFVLEGDVLIRVVGPRPLTPKESREAIDAIALGRERTQAQDLLFDVQQLADLAQKALSSGVNDETTAVLAANELVVLLDAAVGTELPAHREKRRFPCGDGREIRAAVPGLASVLEEGYAAVARNAGDHPRVLRRLSDGLQRALAAGGPEYTPVLHHTAALLDQRRPADAPGSPLER